MFCGTHPTPPTLMAFSQHIPQPARGKPARKGSRQVPGHKRVAVTRRSWATGGQRGLGGARKIWGRGATKWVNLGKDGDEKCSFQMGEQGQQGWGRGVQGQCRSWGSPGPEWSGASCFPCPCPLHTPQLPLSPSPQVVPFLKMTAW